MKAVFYSAVFGVAGGTCLAAVHIASRIEGFATDPLTYRWMMAGCWFSLAAGVLGAIVALARRRQASPVFSALTVSACIGVALLAVWTQVAALPNYIRNREPLRPNSAAALDGESRVLFAVMADGLAASEPRRSAS